MQARHVVPFVVLLFWQVAPVQVEHGPSGRYRLSLGFGGGAYPKDYTDCDGRTQTSSDGYASAGAVFEAWPASEVRVSAFGGQYAIGSGATERPRGSVGGFQLAWEGRLAGLGGGLVGSSWSTGREGLSAYLRLGDADALHLRADLRQPTETWLTPGWARIGVGYHLGAGRGRGIFVGLSRVLGPAPVNGGPREETAVFLDVIWGLRSAVDILARGHTGPGVASLGLGARFNFGSVPP